MSRFARHFFICQTRRPSMGKPSCGAQGSEGIAALFMEARNAHPELWRTVQVSPSGCLGPCFYGPAIVVYPEGVWYAPVTLDDAREIIETHLVKGEVVERLRYVWPEI